MSRKNSNIFAIQIFAIHTAVCGARTRACRVHTRVNASDPSRVCTRPGIVLRPDNQTSLHRIPLNVIADFVPFPVIANPVIIGLALPKLRARTVKQPVCLARRGAFQRLQQHARRNRRQQKHVDMVRHDHEGSEMVLAQALASKQRFDYDGCDRFAPQIDGTTVRPIQIAIHPRESFAIGDFTGWRKMRAGQAAVQVPGDEHPAVFGIDVREPAVGVHCGSNQKPETPMSFDE